MCVMNTAPENNPLRDLNNARNLPSGDLLPITAMQDEIQRRFGELEEKVRSLFSDWTNRYDIPPTDVWLGPDDAFAYYAFKLREGMMLNEELTPRLFSGDIEGMEICGLTVRLMKREGVRVGCTLGE